MTRTLEWNVRLYLDEDDGDTRARVVLDTGVTTLTGRGTARCNPADIDVPRIGDELAAGRAMNDLGRHLMRAANRDLGEMGAGIPGERDEETGYGWSAVGA
ncbi:DUF1876 domain-containing protein [Streptomyces sp. SP18CS02]|uniref:DUF1876 domain-containing protein n=1 Tax=Streptomyces sp. SP18CS02 TaxID=3002531 RepID=UPI002E78F31E|nr:DUF1876 domain-containing protein [Streptomyces sp. SP18CS02]MEE1754665.1 DUF1876 domain-containing protein [Streptomyces sp. SP18CS02]